MHRGPDRKLHLGVMAKHWTSGRVKTRLGATIGMRQAAEVHRAFCHHLAGRLATTADQRSFVVSPPERQADFRASLPQDWQIEIQSDGDLGCRMMAWFSADCGGDCGGDGQVDRVLIGADCPLLDGSVIRQTGELLGSHDVVLGPAIDGGYYLIALRGPWRAAYQRLMEQMPWSGASVFRLTCRRAEEAGLRLATLATMEDVDTIKELEQLMIRLEQCSSDADCRTLRRSIEQAISQPGRERGEE
ncbi:TIGR04282 family arsenosugar biosynthesis glycosyltransferase [Stieleria mannarensis]|uniref:TIGR04282 family arsenosugar biosynthesis glycosyltransferase n=1 Tax=Stieleria mannarensis TaxID=2755585 RepID=UPI00160409EC|nr:TIGR04282 family arsenosugar biosynthesis glycosyltransferase [Rhodopirellula sp. JC639]